jgi:hypothetical protein
MRLLTKDGREVEPVRSSSVELAGLGVRWIVEQIDGGGFEHWLVDDRGYLVERTIRVDAFSFPFADCIVRRLCHAKAQRSGWPTEWAELALDIAIPRLWSRVNRNMSGVGELPYAIVLRDHAYAQMFRSMSDERNAVLWWKAKRGELCRIVERPAFVPYNPSIGSKRDAYRLIGFDPIESGSYCG